MVMLCHKIEKADLPLFLSVAGSNWVAEEKYDGDRIRLRVKGGYISLHNKKGTDVTFRYPEFSIRTDLPDCFLDGEMCVMKNGVSAFNDGIAFRTHCKDPAKIRAYMDMYPVTYVAFDVLELNGTDTTHMPLHQRRNMLEDNFDCRFGNIIISEMFTDIQKGWDKVTSKGGEGLILKDLNSLYHENKRHSAWRKVKDVKEVDLRFTKYETHNMGITLENDEGIRVVVNGAQAQEVAQIVDTTGSVTGAIRHLGQTETGKYRQPTWFGVR